MPAGKDAPETNQIFDVSILGRTATDERWEYVTPDGRRPVIVSSVPLGRVGDASVAVFQFDGTNESA